MIPRPVDRAERAPGKDLAALANDAARRPGGMMTLPWAGGGTIDIDSGKIYAVSYGSHGAGVVRVSMDNEAKMDFEMDFDVFRAMLKAARAGEYVDFRDHEPQAPAPAPKKQSRLAAALRRPG